MVGGLFGWGREKEIDALTGFSRRLLVSPAGGLSQSISETAFALRFALG
jgi:hypothetical protein